MTPEQKLTLIHRFLTAPGVNKSWVALQLWGNKKTTSWRSSTITQKIRGMNPDLPEDAPNIQYWTEQEVDRLVEIREEFRKSI